MTVRVLIETENAAFADEAGAAETARILRVAAETVEEIGLEAESLAAGVSLRDLNGNTVGRLQAVR